MDTFEEIRFMNDKKKFRRLKFLLNGNTQHFWMYDQRYYLGVENQLHHWRGLWNL